MRKRSAGMTPGAVLLPGIARFMQRMQDGECADLGQPIGDGSQRPLQERQRPRSSRIFLVVWWPTRSKSTIRSWNAFPFSKGRAAHDICYLPHQLLCGW